ncbi:hypothetical protein GCM10027563_33750 [Parasphingorhabdus pacifica]
MDSAAVPDFSAVPVCAVFAAAGPSVGLGSGAPVLDSADEGVPLSGVGPGCWVDAVAFVLCPTSVAGSAAPTAVAPSHVPRAIPPTSEALAASARMRAQRLRCAQVLVTPITACLDSPRERATSSSRESGWSAPHAVFNHPDRGCHAAKCRCAATLQRFSMQSGDRERSLGSPDG